MEQILPKNSDYFHTYFFTQGRVDLKALLNFALRKSPIMDHSRDGISTTNYPKTIKEIVATSQEPFFMALRDNILAEKKAKEQLSTLAKQIKFYPNLTEKT